MLTDLFASASDENLALLMRVLAAVIVILAASALLGRAARLVGQPRVLGETIAGIVLGPTLFGALFPSAQAALFPEQVTSVLYVLSIIGLTLYVFLVGVSIDHGGRGQSGRDAGVLALFGSAPALLAGAGVALIFYDQLSHSDVSPVQFALFVGGALSITALPVLARIIFERGLQETKLGRLVLLASSIEDAAAWCLLALLSALHLGSGPQQAAVTIGLTIVFTVFVLVVVARLLGPLGRKVERTGRLSQDQLFVVLIVVLLAGLFTDLIGVYSVFGGFLAGLAMPREKVFRQAVQTRMTDVVSVLFLPLFFTYSGLHTRIDGLLDWWVLGPLLVLLFVAFASKFAGCAVGMRILGHSWRESGAAGCLMNARGMMILVYANIGLSQGMITEEVFTIFVVIALVTTAAAVPLFGLAHRVRPRRAHIPPDPDEIAVVRSGTGQR